MTPPISSIGKKLIMAVTGIMLSLFIIIHTIGNTSALFGRAAYNHYAETLHRLGFLLQISEGLLLLALLLHIYYGLKLALENHQARDTGYRGKRRRLSSIPGWAMPYTGALILFFIGFHYYQLHRPGGMTETALKVRTILTITPSALFYLLAIAALTLHTVHGFWSLNQTLGINYPQYNPLIKGVSLVAALAVGIGLMLLPILALFTADFLL
ncbi:MAG: succinate dehydrogenase cytochrome b subunit [Proteobacteria bacterium]|nr:succinate dehydrogenase cytochrome b subunit [Pseudomonadota bacterium]MBU1688996.1 succinate dehydrogenase cytochrome b subunit [Pseudomonadota bacterium]